MKHMIFIALMGAVLLAPNMHAFAAQEEELDFTTVPPEIIGLLLTFIFEDDPEMVRIAKCESGFRQYDVSGDALRGGEGQSMIGLYQLHERYHRTAAKDKGWDIDSLVGNILYARYLLEEEGLTPWNSSRGCWQA